MTRTQLRDAAERWALYTGSQNNPNATDRYGLWCAADREAVALYRECVAAVKAASQGTRYGCGDPEYL